ESLRTIVQAVAREAGDRATLEFDPSLVRGMGYYTGPIFEALYGGGTSAIAGGGRYDRMVGRLLGYDVPACGFSIGFERVVSILEERSGGAAPSRARIAFLFDRDDPLTEVVAAAGRLRHGDRVVSLTLKRKNLAKQLDDLAGEGFGAYAMLRPGVERAEIKPLARRAAGGAGTDGQPPNASVRRPRARARRGYRPALGLAPPKARPRPPLVPRSPRPLRDHAMRARQLEPAVQDGRAAAPRERDHRGREGRAAGACRRQSEAADGRDRGLRRRADRAVRGGSAAAPSNHRRPVSRR